ncbi:endolytic transglycosylase MltG [Candidatus Clostridium radicumherbarum]|uniref:Endolytic murein transglycosylase n=1 Tax=Candidatus Clostridium radicumherbarum TaxID=3381662 RepID=A0ABW8TRK9_9CLOT
MKKVFSVIIVILVVLGILGFIIYRDALKTIRHPFISTTSNVEVKVNSGDSLNTVIEGLASEKKIGNSFLIKWYIKNQKLSSNIKPGTYSFAANTSIEDFVKGLEEGRDNLNTIKITIPEGYDIDQIAQLLEKDGLFKKEDFINAVNSYKLPSYIKQDDKKRYALEGYLFPDTYIFGKNTKCSEVIKTMLNRFEEVVSEVNKNNNGAIKDENIENIITMASVIEKEAVTESDRPKVASVFYNRINKNMKLQSDATVIYALNVHKEVVYTNDLKVNSPYNTYLVQGLPIGPICSPGKSSIVAALNPEKSKNIYFIIIKDGPHFFSDNYNEFLKIKKQYIDSNIKK